ncbi:D(2) dopamine receptor-like [Gigantopelta aegis]|uniref:D(2) dopamine receptor-like n=1 Tax=Gigantopelta aegis TaxID=1735272 RepID=UPI001B88A0FB|nr:D(2) dopamine receptor-like [Gigantopelta aegis]XP_041361666.1 D(2) dopamine receptor-like [Gigantopelta aegis]XP_041361667.1 D(2) dopamine receptor-like [Gigantopelta aegis]
MYNTSHATDTTDIMDAANSTPGGLPRGNLSVEDLLSYLDNQTLPTMIPAITYIAVLMLVGLAGNCLVLAVYVKKFRPSTTRVFVVSLAIFDLTTCAVSLPGEILDMRFTHTFDYSVLCKFLRFNNSFTVIASGFTLIAVAIDRYRKICRPLHKQISIRTARVMVTIATCVSLTLSLPTVVLNGRSSVATKYEGVVGTDCSFDDSFKNSIFPMVYVGVFFLVFFGSLVILVVMYAFIGRTVWQHRKFRFNPAGDSKHPSPLNSTSETDISSSDHDSGKRLSSARKYKLTGDETKQNAKLTWISKKKSSVPSIVINSPQNPGNNAQSPVSHNQFSASGTEPESELDRQQLINEKRRTLRFSTEIGKENDIKMKVFSKSGITFKEKGDKNDNKVKKRSKTTLMLFIITAVFIVSFLPHLVLMIVREMKDDFMTSLTDGGVMVYNIFLRSYFINSATNCFVYSFCNVKFRNALRRFICPCAPHQFP